jgi:hypothetical protein
MVVIVTLRLVGMIACILAVFGLFRWTIARPGGLSVFHTVYLHCILLLVTLCYYCLVKFVIFLCFPRVRPAPRSIQVDFASELVASRSASTTLSVPRLTIWNVWVLVYGLGSVFFITGYCFLGLHPICMAFLGLAVAVLGVDELLCPRVKLGTCYAGGRGAVLAATLLALVLVSADLFDSVVGTYISTLDLYSIFFAMVFPFCSQFILIIIRDCRRYTLGGVVELCEFGFPFTAFLGTFHLCVAYGQRFQTDTDALKEYASHHNKSGAGWYPPALDDGTFIETTWPHLVFYMLTPFFLTPALVCYLSCVLEGCAVDPLLSLTFALSVEHVITRSSGPTSGLGIAGTVFSVIALMVRIMCEYRPRLTGELYSLQSESSQLTHQVVWGRDRSREVDELTSDLQTEMAMMT